MVFYSPMTIAYLELERSNLCKRRKGYWEILTSSHDARLDRSSCFEKCLTLL